VYGLVFLVLACSQGAWFVPTGEKIPDRPPKKVSDIKIYSDADEPRCKYRIVGYYKARNGLSRIPEDAAARGFDGVTDMACAPPGTVDSEWGLCTAKGYVCE
jgi:hypothetical protein